MKYLPLNIDKVKKSQVQAAENQTIILPINKRKESRYNKNKSLFAIGRDYITDKSQGQED